MGSHPGQPRTEKLFFQEHNKNTNKISIEQIAVQAQGLHLLQQRGLIIKYGESEKFQKFGPRELIKEEGKKPQLLIQLGEHPQASSIEAQHIGKNGGLGSGDRAEVTRVRAGAGLMCIFLAVGVAGKRLLLPY